MTPTNMAEPTLIEPLAFVRSHPTMFFGEAAPNALDCVQHLCAEVFARGSPDLTVERLGRWWICWSSFDWFRAEDPASMLSRIVALPEYRDNASCVEIVLLAFADAVTTYGALTGDLVASGDSPPEEVWTAMRKGARGLAFRF